MGIFNFHLFQGLFVFSNFLPLCTQTIKLLVISHATTLKTLDTKYEQMRQSQSLKLFYEENCYSSFAY